MTNAKHRAYVAYKVVSEDLFEHVKPGDWSNVADWTVQERALEYERIRRLYFRCKLCFERRLRYKFDHVPSSQWDEGHERAIDQAKTKTAAFLRQLEELTLLLDRVTEPSSNTTASVEVDEGGDAVARLPSRCPKKKIVTPVSSMEEDWEAYKAAADAEGTAIYEGLYDNILTLIQKHAPQTSDSTIDALASTVISMVPLDEFPFLWSWKERALAVKRALTKLPKNTLDEIVVDVVNLYGEKFAELSKRPEYPTIIVGCETLPPAFVKLARQLGPCPTIFINKETLPSNFAFNEIRSMLLFNIVLHGAGAVLGQFRITEKDALWATIEAVRTLSKAQNIDDLIGLTIKSRELLERESMFLMLAVEGDPRLFEVGDAAYRPAGEQAVRQFKELASKDLRAPLAIYKVLYLLMTQKVRLYDMILRPREFLRVWVSSNVVAKLDTLTGFQLDVLSICLIKGYGKDLLDSALYFVRIEGWDVSFIRQVRTAHEANIVSPELRRTLPQPAHSCLAAKTFDEFITKYNVTGA